MLHKNFVDELLVDGIGSLIGGDYYHNLPHVNISQKGHLLRYELACPGYAKDDFDINVDGLKLMVGIKHIDTVTVKSTFKRKEFDYTGFKRFFDLPTCIDKNQITASYTHGVLYIEVDTTVLDDSSTTSIEIR